MKFTLVVPVAPERDAPIIDSIKNLDYPKNEFHVVVVKGINPSENRNKGIMKANGEIIVFLDDDAIIESDYLNKVEEFFSNHPEIDIVGGPQLTPRSDKGFAKISGYGLSSKFGAWKLSNRYSENKEILNADETAITSANLICKRKVFEKVKFDENIFPGEDPKFISEAKELGFKVAYSPDIIVYHRRRPTIKSFVKQIFNYGKVRPQLARFYETLKMPFFFIPSLFFIYLVLLVVVISINPSITGSVVGVYRGNFNFGFLLFLPLATYILLAVLFSIFDSAKNNDLKSFILLIFIYPIIHISYGVGMIWGYFRKVI